MDNGGGGSAGPGGEHSQSSVQISSLSLRFQLQAPSEISRVVLGRCFEVSWSGARRSLQLETRFELK